LQSIEIPARALEAGADAAITSPVAGTFNMNVATLLKNATKNNGETFSSPKVVKIDGSPQETHNIQQPKQVYHGTASAGFKEFDISK
jgi:hypothetical protein